VKDQKFDEILRNDLIEDNFTAPVLLKKYDSSYLYVSNNMK